MRLAGSPNLNEGRVEVYNNGEWGTLCQNAWDIKSAHVVCRSIGYGIASRATLGSFLGPLDGQKWSRTMQCSGTELELQQCKKDEWTNAKGWSGEECSNAYTAGVICLESGKRVSLHKMLCLDIGELFVIF